MKYKIQHKYDGIEIWTSYDDQKKTHREAGPAEIRTNGQKAWLQHDKIHREIGPAYIDSDGYQEEWLNDMKQSESYQVL
jgi:hypothetical protein